MRGQPILHVVRWWLPQATSAALRQDFHSRVAALREIPGVRDLVSGTPTHLEWAGPDQSWDLGFAITFEDLAAAEAYMAHPAHRALVTLAGEIAERIDIFYLEHATAAGPTTHR